MDGRTFLRTSVIPIMPGSYNALNNQHIHFIVLCLIADTALHLNPFYCQQTKVRV